MLLGVIKKKRKSETRENMAENDVEGRRRGDKRA